MAGFSVLFFLVPMFLHPVNVFATIVTLDFPRAVALYTSVPEPARVRSLLVSAILAPRFHPLIAFGGSFTDEKITVQLNRLVF